MENPVLKLVLFQKLIPKYLKKNWLFSLLINGINSNRIEGVEVNGRLEWVIGVDPDVTCALSLLKFDCNGIISAQVSNFQHKLNFFSIGCFWFDFFTFIFFFVANWFNFGGFD